MAMAMAMLVFSSLDSSLQNPLSLLHRRLLLRRIRPLYHRRHRHRPRPPHLLLLPSGSFFLPFLLPKELLASSDRPSSPLTNGLPDAAPRFRTTTSRSFSARERFPSALFLSFHNHHLVLLLLLLKIRRICLGSQFIFLSILLLHIFFVCQESA